MITPMGRKHQIDYMFGLRYVLSPQYRAKVREYVATNPGMKVLYMFGGLVSTAVVILALLLLTLALQSLLAN